MKNCFMITSCIETDKQSHFKGTRSRSFFSDQERLEQTIFQLRVISQRNPDSKIFLVDVSEKEFTEIYDWNIPHLSYIRLETLNPELCKIIRTHPSKSHCECLLVLEFLKHFKYELEEYDFVTKMSGRYLYSHGEHDKFFIPENRNKFFFKDELIFAGKDIEGMTRFPHPREILIDNILHGFVTVLYGFGIEKIDIFEILINACAATSTEHSRFFNVDIEYSMNHFVRKLGLLDDVVTVPWVVDGECGVTGRLLSF